MTTGVGGAATTAVPGLDHWPPSTVLVIVAAVTVLGGIVRKLLSAALVAVVVTVVLIAGDAVTGGHIQQGLNLGGLLGLGGGSA
ncbi:hypothetical protein [Mycolicibacterium sp.]|uniref:hypothetical protein n=1 Tax=Mycolicibacterium sp. TaxID=2320850 RepID=UPI003561153A